MYISHNAILDEFILASTSCRDAAVCCVPGSTAWKLQWCAGPATHFSNRFVIVYTLHCMGFAWAAHIMQIHKLHKAFIIFLNVAADKV